MKISIKNTKKTSKKRCFLGSGRGGEGRGMVGIFLKKRVFFASWGHEGSRRVKFHNFYQKNVFLKTRSHGNPIIKVGVKKSDNFYKKLKKTQKNGQKTWKNAKKVPNFAQILFRVYWGKRDFFCEKTCFFRGPPNFGVFGGFRGVSEGFFANKT